MDRIEKILEIFWEGPFSKESLNSYATANPDAADVWKVYAIYDDHPLYGKDVLSYIGKAVKQPLQKRVNQHDWWERKIYVASIWNFSSWQKSEDWDYDDALTDDKSVSKVEELLIFALTPAYNKRNKGSAKLSRDTRIFNTGSIGSLPVEVSGWYAIEGSPNPDEDEKEIVV